MNTVASFKMFLDNLESLKLPNVRYYLELKEFDDIDDGDGFKYIKAVCKQLPHIDKLVCLKSLLHSYAFCEIFWGLKLLIIKDCHFKFYPFAPESLQQIILKNCVILTKINSKEGDFKSCKIFVIQDCVVNYKAFLHNNLNKAIVETIAFLDVDIRDIFEYDPLYQFSWKMN